MDNGKPKTLVYLLKETLPQTDLSWVLPGLWQDPIVWKTVQKPDIRKRAVRDIGANSKFWKPAVLAFISLDLTDSNPLNLVEHLRVDLQYPLDIELKKQAAGVLEKRLQSKSEIENAGEADQTLEKAALAALALRERRRILGNWGGLGKEIINPVWQQGPVASTQIHYWSTPISILYGIVPDPSDLLVSLINDGSDPGFCYLALHAFLSNPLPEEEQIQIVTDVLKTIPAEASSTLLSLLYEQRPDLASNVGRAAVEIAQTEGHWSEEPEGYYEQVIYLKNLFQKAEIQNIIGDYQTARAVFKQAWKASNRLMAALASKMAEVSEAENSAKDALLNWEEAAEISPHGGDALYYSARLANLLLDFGRIEDARTWLPDEDILQAKAYFPIYSLITTLFGQARLAYLTGETEHTKRLAVGLLEKIENDDSGLFSQNFYTIQRLPRLLMDLGLPRESSRAIRIALIYKSFDIELLKLLAEVENLMGNCEEAAQSLEAAAALAPQRIDLRRQFAFYLEEAGRWGSALVERKAILEDTSSSILLGDLTALARCALFAGQPDKTLEACIQTMNLCEDEVNQSEVHTLMGEALASLGKKQEAQEEYKKATELTPHLASPWIALARLQKEEDQVHLALETLRACTLAAPDSPEAHLVMGEAYLDDWEGREHPALSQALEALRQAYDLLDNTGSLDTLKSKIAFKYGETLYKLGHLHEARQVLEPIFQSRPSYPGLSSILAGILMTLNDPRSALPALEAALKTSSDDPSLHLDFAKALLAVKERPGEAIAAARRVLELDSTRIEAHALLAEALYARGEFNEALTAYQDALETNLIEDPDWSTRLSVGLGNVALALEQPDIAIATLQEAANAAPKDPLIVRILSEAYQAAGFIQEGIEAARSALRLALDDLDTLIWFSGQALKWINERIISESDGTNQKGIPWSVSLQVQVEALNALNHAIQIAPDKTDLRVRLGLLQMKSGEKLDAIETLGAVVSDEHASVDDLQKTAQYLIELDEPGGAISCLERAIQMHSSTSNIKGEIGKSLLRSLVNAYHKAGNILAALETLENALTFSPEDVSLYLAKADLLLSQNRIQDSLECLNQALELAPESDESRKLRRKAAVILRTAGKLPDALAQIEKILETSGLPSNHRYLLSARISAAELSRAMLQPQKARAYLGAPPALVIEGDETADNDLPSYRSLCLAYLILDAELGLDLGEEAEVIDLYNQTDQIRAEASEKDLELTRVRIQVLDARLKARREDQDAGIQLLQKIVGEEKWSLEDISNSEDNSIALSKAEGSGINGEIYLNMAAKMSSVAEAALEFGEWDTALYLLRQACELTPQEPQPFYQLARSLVLRAEAQRLCQALDIVQHSPGPSAIAEHAKVSFEQTIDIIERQLEKWNRENNPTWARGSSSASAQVARWRARGMAAFNPGVANAQQLAASAAGPSDVAAQIAALRNSWHEFDPKEYGDLDEGTKTASRQNSIPANAIQAARSYPNNPLVLSQLALALSLQHNDLQDALRAARQAVRNSNGSTKAFSNTPMPLRPSQTAISNALLARLAYKSGENNLARTAIQTALEIWPNESRWHSLASSINQSFGDQALAVAHLEQAVVLEPKYIPHYLALGNAYLEHRNVRFNEADQGDSMAHRAIQTLEQAARLAPDQAEPWLALGKAYLMSGDLDNAAASTEKAIELSSGQGRPYILRAEIALRSGNYKEAFNYLQNTFNIEGGNPEFTSDTSIILLQTRVLDGLDRTSEALAALEKCLPNVREPLPLLLERVNLVGRLQGAKAGLEAMVELGERHPDEPMVLAPLALKLAEAGMKEAALKNAQKALLHLSSQGEGTLEIDYSEKANLHNMVGRLFRETGHLDQAVHHLSEAIELNPGLIEAYLELGRAHQDRRQQAVALQIYNQASRVDPKDPRPYYHAGLALKESKDYLGAESMLRRSAELAPSDLNIHRQLGAIVALNLVHNRKRRSLE
jgi:tetratricopeptide (TPR) repeat protein